MILERATKVGTRTLVAMAITIAHRCMRLVIGAKGFKHAKITTVVAIIATNMAITAAHTGKVQHSFQEITTWISIGAVIRGLHCSEGFVPQ